MSSLRSPWLSFKDKMLSDKSSQNFPFSFFLLPKNQQLQNRSPMSNKLDGCMYFVFKLKLILDFPRPFAFFVVTLTSCACLWKCRVWGSVFFFRGDTFACLPPQQEEEGAKECSATVTE